MVEIDRDFRQALQNKAIKLLNSEKYIDGLGGTAAQKVKEMWDKYDEWKLRVLS